MLRTSNNLKFLQTLSTWNYTNVQVPRVFIVFHLEKLEMSYEIICCNFVFELVALFRISHACCWLLIVVNQNNVSEKWMMLPGS